MCAVKVGSKARPEREPSRPKPPRGKMPSEGPSPEGEPAPRRSVAWSAAVREPSEAAEGAAEAQPSDAGASLRRAVIKPIVGGPAPEGGAPAATPGSGPAPEEPRPAAEAAPPEAEPEPPAPPTGPLPEGPPERERPEEERDYARVSPLGLVAAGVQDPERFVRLAGVFARDGELWLGLGALVALYALLAGWMEVQGGEVAHIVAALGWWGALLFVALSRFLAQAAAYPFGALLVHYSMPEEERERRYSAVLASPAFVVLVLSNVLVLAVGRLQLDGTLPEAVAMMLEALFGVGLALWALYMLWCYVLLFEERPPTRFALLAAAASLGTLAAQVGLRRLLFAALALGAA